MLVLSRKQGQRIVVDDEIEITVVAVSRQGVRIGISAPRSVPIVRQELLCTDPTHRREEQRLAKAHA